MNQRQHLPTTIPAYLAQLRGALAGADAAMIQDALYDAEEYLRAELAAHPGKSEAEVIADVAGSYGAPDEVADIYRQTEATVQAALRTPTLPGHGHTHGLGQAGDAVPPTVMQARPAGASFWQRLFGVYQDPRSWGALLYMLLSLATGIFYFTWTVTGLSLTLGSMVLIIGLPLFVLFVGASRVLALVEGRIVEVMLGQRMPRRPLYQQRDLPLLKRIKHMLVDRRTWSAFVYFLLMLPLGIAYFTFAVTGLSVAFGLIFAPLAALLGQPHWVQVGNLEVAAHAWMWPLLVLAGVAVLVLLMHLARGIGQLHARLAKAMLVKLGTAD